MAVKEEKVEVAKPIKCIVRSLDKDEKDMVFGHNGKMVQVKLGEEVELTKDQIRVIKDAEMIKYEAETAKDGSFTGKNRVVKEPRYIVEIVL